MANHMVEAVRRAFREEPRLGPGFDLADVAVMRSHIPRRGDHDLKALGSVFAQGGDDREIRSLFSVVDVRLVDGERAVEVHDQALHDYFFACWREATR